MAEKTTEKTKRKRESRAATWALAAAQAKEALEALSEMQEQFQEWRDNLSENLSGSATAEKLDAVCELDITGALDTVTEAESLDLPLGYGRD